MFPQVEKQLVHICRKYTAALVWQFQSENLTGKREKDSDSFMEKFIPGLPGGSVVRHPPVSAGDTGSIPDPGRSHMLRSS